MLKHGKKRHTNLPMVWIDYKKVYDFFRHSWINKCMESFGIADNKRNFLEKSMEQWKLSRGIFQGDSLSPLYFVLSKVPLSLILRKVNGGYEWGNKEYKLNHLLFIDALKLFSKSEGQMDTLVRTIHVFSTDIEMEFGTKKRGIFSMERTKVVRCEE